jgi:hypothetical protein
VKTTNSKCVCEAVKLYAMLVILSLIRLPLPVALKMAVASSCSVPAFCTAEYEEGGKIAPYLLERCWWIKRVKIT